MSVQASVAVVIPVHDGEAFLAETLASVAAQTLPAAEVIVVDDGSTDRSAAVARAAGARVLQQANAGPGAARNRGAAASTSELIAFLDADDLFEPDKLARQVAALASAPDAAGACSDALVLGGPRDGTRRNAGRRLPPVLRLRDLLHANPVIASSVVLRRSAFAAAGGFDEDPVLIATEDYDLWLRVLDAPGAHLLYVDAPLVRYRVHGAGLSAGDRFVAGIDRVMAKLAAGHPGDREIAAAAAARRAEARLDAAWASLQRGERARARRLIAEARACDGWTWKAARMWLRSYL